MLTLIRAISKFFPKIGVIALFASIFAAGTASGGWMVYKWSQAQEAGRVKAIMAQKDKAAAAAINALDSYYKAEAKIDKTVIKKVIRYAPTDAICDVSDDERRLLNNARTGLPEAASDATETNSRPASSGKLPRAVEVEAHADCGIRYRQVKAQCSALIEWAGQK